MIAFLFFIFVPASLHAQTTGAPFLEVDPSPRSYALGSAGAGVASGAQAIGQNPANLGLLSQPYEAFASYETLLGNAKYEHAAFAAALAIIPGPIDALGFSVTHLAISGLAGADANGNPTGSFTSGDTAVAVGASSRFSERFRLGVAVKVVQSQFSSFSSNWAVAGDFGLVYDIPRDDRPISLALSVNNVGQGQKFISQTDPLPSSVQAAAAYPVGQSSLAVAQLRDYIYDHAAQASLGYEYGMGPAAFRIGYSYFFGAPSNLALSDQATAQKVLNGLSGGVGVRWGSIRLDYAVSPQAVGFGPTQRVALTVAWGERAQEKLPQTHARKTSRNKKAVVPRSADSPSRPIDSPW